MPRAVVINLWGANGPFIGVTYPIFCMSDTYIMIHDTDKITVMK